jgi:hypothetical protein
MSYSYADKEREIQDARAEYQELLAPFNRPAPTPFPDENQEQYRRRVLPIVQSVVPGFETLKIDNYLREPNFNFIEKQVQEAAIREARHPTNIPDGELREVQRLDPSGRPFYEFYGKPSAWMSHFTGGTKKILKGIRTENEQGFVPSNMRNNLR